MKKSILTLCLLLVCIMVYAGKFVLIPVNETNNLKTLFSNHDLKIHYYNDDYVLATTDNLNFEGITILDEYAFEDVNSYAIVYCFENQKEEYLTRIAGSVKTLHSGNNFFIMKLIGEGFLPAKNDGMMIIMNSEARLPTSDIVFQKVTERDEFIESCINQVSIDRVMGNIQTLENFVTRRCDHANSILAQNWIKEQFEDMGLSPYIQNVPGYPWWGGSIVSGNVIAVQTGIEFPDEYIVCGGHYDSFAYMSPSGEPGADDDASGTVGVIEAAKILSQYESKRSIVYCAFAAEECGLNGSAFYAQQCVNQGMNILGYFNLDMIGFLQSGNALKIYLLYPNSALTLADFFVDVCETYFQDIPIVKHPNHTLNAQSDHASFNNKGYKGIWWFEDVNNVSPYIHTPNDKIGSSVNNQEQVTVFTQALVASIATLAEIQGTLPPPLNPPTNCLAEYFEEMSIQVTWDVPDSPEPDGYDIYRDEVKKNEDLWTTTIYTDTVNDYEKHCYKIKAVWGNQESEFSNESCDSVPPPFIMPIPPPENCFAEHLEEMNIQVSWDAPEENTPKEYFIYRDSAKIDQTIELYYIDSVEDNEEYCYMVTAVYAGLYDDVESEFSNKSCASVPVKIIEYNSKFKIYPNPTTGELLIVMNNEQLIMNNVEIFDMKGRKLYSNHLIPSSSHHQINISHLPSGTYFIKIANEIVGKLIKE